MVFACFIFVYLFVLAKKTGVCHTFTGRKKCDRVLGFAGKALHLHRDIKENNKNMKKSILIEDTTVEERIEIVKASLNFGDGECEGVDMEDMYDDYIFGRRELMDINREFSQKHAGEVKSGDRERSSSCMK